MYRIIGGDGREYGPVTGDSIRQWVLQNRANAKTLVRADDSADWRPLGEIPEFASSFGAPPPQPSDAPPPPPPPAAPAAPAFEKDAWAASIAVRDYHLGIANTIGGAFRLLGTNYWGAVGVTMLVMLGFIVTSFIPVVNFFAGLLLEQVFYAGLYLYFVKMARSEAPTVADGFSGFSIAIGQLMLLTLVTKLLIVVICLPIILPLVGLIAWEWSPNVMVPLLIVLVLPVIYIAIAWTFSSLLVIDRGLEFWDAMELSRKVVSKHWFKVFFTMLFSAILAASSIIVLSLIFAPFMGPDASSVMLMFLFVLLAFVVGSFTFPILFAAIAVAYETLFPSE